MENNIKNVIVHVHRMTFNLLGHILLRSETICEDVQTTVFQLYLYLVVSFIGGRNSIYVILRENSQVCCKMLTNLTI